MNQSCQVLKRTLLNGPHVLHQGPQMVATRLKNAVPLLQAAPTRTSVAVGMSPRQEKWVLGSSSLKEPVIASYTEVLDKKWCNIPDALVAQFATLAFQGLAHSPSEDDRARQAQKYAQQLLPVFSKPIPPAAQTAVAYLLENPDGPDSIAKRLVVTLIQHHCFTAATALHAISSRFGLGSSLQDLLEIIQSARNSLLPHRARNGPAHIHLVNYLISRLRQAIVQKPANQNEQARRSIACLLSIMYRLKRFDKVLFLQQLAQTQAIALAPTCYNVVYESIFKIWRQGGMRQESLIPTLGRVMKQMDQDRAEITVEGKATLLRLLGQMLLKYQKEAKTRNLSENEDWKRIVSKILGIESSQSSRQMPAKTATKTADSLSSAIKFPRLHPALLFTWTELLLHDLESSSGSRRTSCNRASLENDPWSIEYAMHCIADREWSLEPTSSTGNSVESTRFAVEQYTTELRRSEILARYAIHSNSFHEAFRHFHQMYLYSRRYQRRISGIVYQERRTSRHLQALVDKGSRAMTVRLDSTLRRIWAKVRDERRYDLIPRTLAASRVVTMESGPCGTFSSLWKSLLHLSQLAQEKDKLLADGLAILSQVFDEQEGHMQQSSLTISEAAKKRRRLLQVVRKLYAKPVLMKSTFHAIVNRSLQKASSLRGNTAVGVFVAEMRRQLDTLKKLEIALPESVLKEDHVEMLRMTHLQGRRFGVELGRMLGSYIRII